LGSQNEEKNRRGEDVEKSRTQRTEKREHKIENQQNEVSFYVEKIK
jgi:hypothetical protein